MQIGLFLDRDGTVNEEVDYLSSPSQLRLIPGSAEAIRNANQLGLKVVIITNQSGVARGILTENDLAEIHKKLIELLEQEHAHVDAIYYCPHQPGLGTPPYNIECDCRKPKIGMLTKAAKEFEIDLKKSFVVGDRLIDIQAGNNAGATSLLVLTGYGTHEEATLSQQKNNARIDYIAKDLRDAMSHIRKTLTQKQLSIS